jgi:hypothetical protein
MDLRKVAMHISTNKCVGRAEIILAARCEQPDFSEKSIYWLLNQLIESRLIARVGRNKYILIREGEIRKDYRYIPSEKMQKVISALSKEYPRMEFQAWEAIQFNYFLNHQIAHNTIFIEVEHMLENSVYEFLCDEFHGNVLLKPNQDVYGLYGKDDTIVVLSLITAAPTNKNNIHLALLEKLLVDMMTNKLIPIFVSRSEFPHILEDAFSMYRIDETKMFRYAARRNAAKKIRVFFQENTNVNLKTEDCDA